MRSPSGTAPGSTRGDPPLAMSTTSASTESTPPDSPTTSTRCARGGWSTLNRPVPDSSVTPSRTSRFAMSSDCCRASCLMRVSTVATSTTTSPEPVPTPTRGASRMAVTRSLVAIRVLLGTQSVSTQAPPIPSRSITVTCAPSCAATSADS